MAGAEGAKRSKREVHHTNSSAVLHPLHAGHPLHPLNAGLSDMPDAWLSQLITGECVSAIDKLALFMTCKGMAHSVARHAKATHLQTTGQGKPAARAFRMAAASHSSNLHLTLRGAGSVNLYNQQAWGNIRHLMLENVTCLNAAMWKKLRVDELQSVYTLELAWGDFVDGPLKYRMDKSGNSLSDTILPMLRVLRVMGKDCHVAARELQALPDIVCQRITHLATRHATVLASVGRFPFLQYVELMSVMYACTEELAPAVKAVNAHPSIKHVRLHGVMNLGLWLTKEETAAEQPSNRSNPLIECVLQTEPPFYFGAVSDRVGPHFTFTGSSSLQNQAAAYGTLLGNIMPQLHGMLWFGRDTVTKPAWEAIMERMPPTVTGVGFVDCGIDRVAFTWQQLFSMLPDSVEHVSLVHGYGGSTSAQDILSCLQGAPRGLRSLTYIKASQYPVDQWFIGQWKQSYHGLRNTAAWYWPHVNLQLLLVAADTTVHSL